MQLDPKVRVIGVASGKGGVGKTTISVNLATALAKSGKTVMLLDGDLGLANAQLAFGCQVKYNFSHVLAGVKTLEEIIITTSSGGPTGSRRQRLTRTGVTHLVASRRYAPGL